MKKNLNILFLALIFGGIVSTTSCKKKDETQTVSYNLATHEQYIPAFGSSYSQTSDFDVLPVDVQNGFLSAGVAYDVTKVNTAKLTGLNATATTGTLSDISEIEVFIKLAGASGDGTRIAHSTTLSGSSANPLTVDGVELKGFLATTSTVTTKVTIKASAAGDVNVKLNGGVIQAEVQK